MKWEFSENFILNNHKTQAILQLPVPLLCSPRGEGSQGESRGGWGTPKRSPLRARPITGDLPTPWQHSGMWPAPGWAGLWPRAILCRVLSMTSSCCEAAPLFGCLSCGCSRKRKANQGLIYISWLLEVVPKRNKQTTPNSFKLNHLKKNNNNGKELLSFSVIKAWAKIKNSSGSVHLMTSSLFFPLAYSLHISFLTVPSPLVVMTKLPALPVCGRITL